MSENAENTSSASCCCHRTNMTRAVPHKSNKLKASCDFCALSKVKCDRGQPQCARCIKDNVMCHYSESRRIGKARRLYSASGSSAASVSAKNRDSCARNTWSQPPPPAHQMLSSVGDQHLPPLSASRLAPVRESVGSSVGGSVGDSVRGSPGLSDYHLMTATTSAATSSAAASVVFDHTPQSQPHARTASPPSALDSYPGLSFPDFLQGICQDRSPPPSFPLGLGGQDANPRDLDESLLSELISTGGGTLSNGGCSEIDPALPPSPQNDDTNSSSPDDCISRACSAIKILRGPSVLACCVSANHGRTTATLDQEPQLQRMHSIDDVLKTNRSVRQILLQILACPCAHDSILLCLLALIVRRMIDSYWQLLNQHLSTPTPTTTPLFEGLPDLCSSSSSSSPSFSCSPLSASSMPHGIRRESASSRFDVAIVIGGFVLDGEAGLKAIMHVVRSQIEDMGGLIDALVVRYVDDASNDAFTDVWKKLVESLRACQIKALHTI